MKQGWESKKLGDVCSLIARGVPPKYVETGGIQVINQKCIRSHTIDLSLARRHNVEIKAVNATKLIQIGDVLVNSTGVGTLGRVAQVRNNITSDITVDTHVTIVRPIPDLFFIDFFGYVLIKIEDEIAQSGEGASGQTELARTKLQNNFVVSYPTSLEEQKQIVAKLDQCFEAIDKAKANAAKNLENAKALFQSKLNDIFSQKGEGWVEKKLGDVLNIKRGGSPRPIKKYLTDDPDGLNWIKIGDATASDKYIYKTKQKITKDGLHKTRLVEEGDFILSNSMSFGKPYIMKTTGCIHDGWLTLKEKDGFNIDQDFLYHLLCSPNLFKQFDGLAAGSTVRNLNIALVSSVTVYIPPIDLQKTIVSSLEKIKKQTQSLGSKYQQELNSLEELKKSILQKAFEGEL